MIERSIDRFNAIMVCIASAALIVLGLVMLASTSVWIAEGAEYSLLKKQTFFLGLGFIGASFLAFTDYRWLRKVTWPVYGFAVFLLILCYVPGIGKEVNGETRWIVLPGLGTFQPSEAAKIAMMLGLANWFALHKAEVKKFTKGFLIPSLILGFIVGLIFFEKDMGTSAGLGAAGLALMFVAGVRIRYLSAASVAAIAGVCVIVKHNANRFERIMAFMNLDDPYHQARAGFQQYRAILAFGNGGQDGLGLGNGAEKHGYLPFAHTDFIFPMVGEELGLWFCLLTVLAFGLIAVFGISIAARCSDLFGRLLAVGLTCAIVIPAIVNIGVTTALLPNTGLPLPFISYGGTNLIFTLAMIGLLVSIHRSTLTLSPRGERVLLGRQRGIRL